MSFISFGLNVFLATILAVFGSFGLLYLMFWRKQGPAGYYCQYCDKTFDDAIVQQAQRKI